MPHPRRQMPYRIDDYRGTTSSLMAAVTSTIAQFRLNPPHDIPKPVRTGFDTGIEFHYCPLRKTTDPSGFVTRRQFMTFRRPMPALVSNFPSRSARVAIVLSALFLIPLLPGCSLLNRGKTPTVKVSLPDFDSGDLVHTVAVLPYENHTTIDTTRVQSELFAPITAALSDDCRPMRLLFPQTAGFPKAIAGDGAMASGISDNLALAAVGRNRGISFFIAVRLADLRVESRKKGLFWFRHTDYYGVLDLDVTIFDSETGAKLVDKRFTEESDIDEGDYEAYQSDPHQIPPGTDEALADLADQAADAICDRLSDEPWIGFVTDTNGDLVRLSSGSGNGLHPGLTLSVYAQEKRMTGKDGHQYRVPGLKIGTLTLVSVETDHATGRFAGTAPVQPGDSVRLED